MKLKCNVGNLKKYAKLVFIRGPMSQHNVGYLESRTKITYALSANPLLGSPLALLPKVRYCQYLDQPLV